VIEQVALVSADNRQRAMLATYLRDSGFEVSVYEELAIAEAFGALVYLEHGISSQALRTQVRGWMRGKSPVVVVVTSRPSALDELQTTYGSRLVVFASPVFGWAVVDALRASDPPRPRSA
jgi:DNA-binding response OmpR family regulator